jgi:hypothetical protein
LQTMPALYSRCNFRTDMRLVILSFFCFGALSIQAQVFNLGHTHESFKNLYTNGITYIKTGDPFFDSVMVKRLEEHWKVSSFSVIERYKEPEQNSTALFVAHQKPIRNHQQDRKNDGILVLMPAKYFDEGADYEKNRVDMTKTLGYMFFNGFHDIIYEKDEHRFLKMMLVPLNEGISIIRENQFFDVEEVLNQKVSAAIIEKHKGLVGNTLIIHRDQIVHTIDIEKVKSSGIRYRLLADEEYHNVLDQQDPNHYVLYFGNNKYTELSLIRILTGEIVYTKHFHNDVMSISKKELKSIFAYFK